jgi:hypothetical protein
VCLCSVSVKSFYVFFYLNFLYQAFFKCGIDKIFIYIYIGRMYSSKTKGGVRVVRPNPNTHRKQDSIFSFFYFLDRVKLYIICQ